MFKYFVIGVIVQMIVLMERAVRFPEIYAEIGNDLAIWASLIVLSLINVLLWPISIICEIFHVANGQ